MDREANYQYLKFSAGDQLFLLDVRNVFSIIEQPEVVTLVQEPNYVRGIIDVNGEAVPLIDTSIRLNLKEQVKPEGRAKLIVAHSSEEGVNATFKPLAFMTDDIDDVVTIEDSHFQPLPIDKEIYDERLFIGTVQIDRDFYMLLNINNFYKEDFDEIIKRHIHQLKQFS